MREGEATQPTESVMSSERIVALEREIRENQEVMSLAAEKIRAAQEQIVQHYKSATPCGYVLFDEDILPIWEHVPLIDGNDNPNWTWSIRVMDGACSIALTYYLLAPYEEGQDDVPIAMGWTEGFGSLGRIGFFKTEEEAQNIKGRSGWKQWDRNRANRILGSDIER